MSEAARSLDIGDTLLRRWKREFEEEAAAERGPHLRMEKEILKKPASTLRRK